MSEQAAELVPSQITLSWEQGKALYFLEDSTTEEVLLGGAAGPGKTFLGCYWQIKRRLRYPGTRGLIGRKELKTLKDTTLMTFFDVAAMMGIQKGRHYDYQEQKGRINFFNGSIIFLFELAFKPGDKDFSGLGSLEITDGFIDQVEEITKRARDIVFSRIRYKIDEVGGVPKLLQCCNPANNWLKHDMVMDKFNRPITLPPHRKYIRALLDSNPVATFRKHYRQTLLRLDSYDQKRLLDGDWTATENDRPFFDLFNHKVNVSRFKLRVDKNLPLWLSFDFNINPTSVIVGQKLEGLGCRTYNTLEAIGTESLCHLILEQHGGPPGGYQVTGDHSGHSGNSAAGVLPGGQYHTDFEVIKQVLRLTEHDLVETRAANARHEYSRRLCRHFLSKVPYLIDGTNENNELLISDLQNAKFINGKLYKNREDGNAMDKSDAFRYQINGWFQGDFSILDEYAKTIG